MKNIPAICLSLTLVLTAQTWAADVGSGLMAYYPFEGNADDQSGNSNNATPQGDFSYVSEGLHGQGLRIHGDNSLFFAGGGHVLLPTFDSALNDGFTYSLWVKDEEIGTSTTNHEAYISFGDADSRQSGIDLTNGLDKIRWSISGGSADIVRSTPITIPEALDKWKHLVFVYEPGDFRGYLNGRLVFQRDVSKEAFPVSHAALGRHWWDSGASSSARMSATFDNVRIYGRALDDADVAALFDSEAKRYEVVGGSFTWNAAKDDAEARGGRLAVLNRAAKIDAANRFLEDLGSWPDLWIGLTDKATEGEWMWITGESLTDENWNEGEPNDSGGEDAAHVRSSGSSGPSLTWNDKPATNVISYLLEEPFRPILDVEAFHESRLGEPVTVDAIPAAGFPKGYAYQWYFEGSAIPESAGGRAKRFVIDGAESNEGTWRVEVTNAAGTSDATFEYRVFADDDGDGLSNHRESSIVGTDPTQADMDGDRLNDFEEVMDYLTRPDVPDSDRDGLPDGDEVHLHSTDPVDADSDDDELTDDAEINVHGSDPNVADSDADGLDDGAEVNSHGTDPVDVDTDGDTVADAIEVRHAQFGFDPTTDSTQRLNAFQAAAAELPGVLTESQKEGLSLGGVGIEPAGDGSFSADFVIEESTDLSTWQTVDTVSRALDVSGTKKFIRVRMPEE